MSRRGRSLLQRGAPGGVGRGYASHLVSIRGQDVPTFLILCCVTLIVSSAGAYSYDRYMIKKDGSIDPGEVGFVAVREPVLPADGLNNGEDVSFGQPLLTVDPRPRAANAEVGGASSAAADAGS